MDSKKWYQSKTIWAGIIGVIIAVYNSAAPALAQGCAADPVGLCVTIPAIPDWVFAVLGAFGIYGRNTASTAIK